MTITAIDFNVSLDNLYLENEDSKVWCYYVITCGLRTIEEEQTAADNKREIH